MTEGTDLSGGAQELKRRLADGEYQSSPGIILDSVGRILRWLTRRDKLPAPWISALAVALLISLIACLGSAFTGGVSRDDFRAIVFGGALIALNLVIANSIFARAFATLGDKLLDGIESNAGLAGIHGWLIAARDTKWPVLIGVLVYVVNTAFILRDPADTYPPLGTIISSGVMLLWTGFMLCYMFQFVVLPLRLSRCQFRLHAEDPASTEILADWSGMMNYVAYMFALMLAMGTWFTVSLVEFEWKTLIFIVPRWLLLIVLFVVNQTATSGVITRSKRKSLNDVEAHMAALRPGTEPPDNETLETLLWLWDYHDRIQGTRSSMLNLKGMLDFANTLLIPLLAFLIASLEAVLDLLGWSA